MAIHEEVLRAARRLCRERGEWVFAAADVVRALPHLNERSVRTHVVSRCCVNAPKNHPHKWPYFRRVGRGQYTVLPPHRREPGPRERSRSAMVVAEPAVRYRPGRPSIARDAIHAVLHREDGMYIAECLEVSVVTQGRTADEVIANLREAIALHLEGGDAASLGFSTAPRLVIMHETTVAVHASRA
jgi:predicted RNase H-like HicB family nuclease